MTALLLAVALVTGLAPATPATTPGAQLDAEAARLDAAAAVGRAQARPTDEPGSLPIYMTEEELQRLDEIGAGHRATDPPPQPARNCAEWEPVQGVIIRYPLGLPYDLIRDYADHTLVYVLVSSGSHNSAVNQFTANGVNMSNVEWLIMSTNTIWTRDYGPAFVYDGNGDQAIIDHIYNRPRPLDDQVNWNLGPILGVEVYGHDLIFTGGNYMTDGHGISFSSDLIWDENPSMSHQQILDVVGPFMGIHTYNVLPDISPWGIHHIDTWAKLLDEETMLVKEVAPSHPDYIECEENAAAIAQMTNCFGRPYRVFRVYCPSIGGSDVASYTNSLILNNRVYVPIFNISGDAEALAVYQQAMPGYEIVGYDGAWLSDDAIHCRGKGIMDKGMLYVDHNPLEDRQYGTGDYEIEALMIAHSDAGLNPDSLQVHWKHDWQTTWTSLTMTPAPEPDTYVATIPEQVPQSVIEYYITAVDNSTPDARRSARPWVAPAHWYSFEIEGSAGVGGSATPVAMRPLQLAPNPFHPQASIRFEIGASGPVTLAVYSASGRLVQRVIDRRILPGGAHTMTWDGTDLSGQRAAAGVYLFRLDTGERVELKRGVLLR